MSAPAGLLGLGSSVPATVRRNDDPIFRAIDVRASAVSAVFAGANERRVLAHGEDLIDLMEAASRAALSMAGTSPSQVDRLIGYESISEHLTPNGLFLLHQRLGLRRDVMVLPINCEFSNFLLGLSAATEAIAANRCDRALVVCGSNWTRFVDYGKAHSVVAGDGAGAALVGPSRRLEIVDYAVETDSGTFDLWTMKARVLDGPTGRHVKVGDDGLAVPTYELARGAHPSFASAAVESSSRLALGLLRKNGVGPSEVTLIPHQTKALIDGWNKAIQPREVLHTFDSLGNMSHASIPVTLAMRAGEIRTPYVLLMAAGTGSHFAAMLLRTGP